GVRRAAGIKHLIGEGRTVLVDRGAADQALVVGELPDGVKDAPSGADDLRADAVAGQKDDVRAHAGLLAEMLSRTCSRVSGRAIEPSTASTNRSCRSSGRRARCLAKPTERTNSRGS